MAGEETSLHTLDLEPQASLEGECQSRGQLERLSRGAGRNGGAPSQKISFSQGEGIA